MKKGINLFYKEVFGYLKDSANYVYLSIFLFFAAGIFGFVFPELFSSYFNEIIRNLIDKTTGLNAAELIFFIFGNNVTGSFVGIFSGIFVGLIPIINIIINGLLVGYVLALAIPIAGFSTILRLVPHGIFELPAIFISIGLGIKMGLFFLTKKNKFKELKRRMLLSFKVFIGVVVPLLIVAAIIEGLLIAFFP